MTGPSTFRSASFDGRIRAVYARMRELPLLGPGLRWLATQLYPQGSRAWVIVQEGLSKDLWMHLDPRYEQSYRTAEYESAVQKVLAENLHRGDTFYEVGAHIGFLSLGAARLVGTEGEVVAFEADPENAARIEEHLQKNSLSQLRVVQQAVWSRTGRLRFQQASSQSSRNTGAIQEDPASGRDSEVIDVEAVALDDFIRGRRPPSLIKIDVEGAELHVLEGADELLAKRKPLVICEVHSAAIAVEVESWFSEKKYVLEWFPGEMGFPRHLIAHPR